MLNRKNFIKLFTLFSISLLVFLAGCGSQPGNQESLTEVSVRLKWVHQVQFAGLYIADQTGLYARENLKVQIDPVDFANTSIDQVVSGKNTFGVASADEVLVARSQGKPVKAVAVIYRISPLIFMSVDGMQLRQPEDLIGKKLSISAGQGTWTLKAMLSRAGIDEGLVELEQASTFDTLECLESADVCDAYYIDGLLRADMQNRNPSVLWPGDFGVPFYADVLFTTDDLIAKDPDLVQRFVRATVLGWQQAIESPQEAVNATLAVDPELDPDFQLRAMQASIPLVDTGLVQIGSMDSDIWQLMYEILLEQNVITSPFNIASAYTSTFVDAIER